MSKSQSYGQFCPVARATEIIASRWTILVLRELLAGSTKFNELRNGVPQMSPSLLSKRLNEMEDAGILEKRPATKSKGFHYFVTESGKELGPIIFTLGTWGQKHVTTEFAKHELDPTLLMWDIQRRIQTSIFPEKGRFVAEFLIKGAPAQRKNWWIKIQDRDVELCLQHPGFEVDIFIESNLKSLTNIWMGTCSIDAAKKNKALVITGNDKYIKNFEKWFLLSPFANK